MFICLCSLLTNQAASLGQSKGRDAEKLFQFTSFHHLVNTPFHFEQSLLFSPTQLCTKPHSKPIFSTGTEKHLLQTKQKL